MAASFVAFEVLFLAGASRLAESGALGTLALSSAMQSSQVCVAAGESTGRRAPPDALVTAWDLGVRMGLHARVAQMIADGNKAAGDARPPEWFAARRRIVDDSAAVLARLSAALKVPAPPPFTPAREATVNIEFVPFVEGESNETGRAIASSYGPAACEIYKMGAYWGHSVMVRTVLPGEPNIYSGEIEFHARRAGLSEPLWQPLIARTPPNADGAALAADADAATVRVTNGLRGTGEPAGAPPGK